MRLLAGAACALVLSACGELPTADAPELSARGFIAESPSLPPAQIGVADSVLTIGDSTTVAITDPYLLTQIQRSRKPPTIVWSSSNSTVAQVDGTGLVVALAEGSSTLMVRVLGRTGSVAIRVETPPPPAAPAPPPAPPAPPPPQGPSELILPADNPAELPREEVVVPTVEGNGTVRRVSAGQSIQAAIDAASPGDVILLAPNTVFTEAVRLRKKTGTGWITIRTDRTPTAQGRRVALNDTASFATIRSPGWNQPALSTDAGAAGYWLVNLDFTVPTSGSLNALVELSGLPSQNTLADVPSRIVIDRSILRGRAHYTLRRCLSLQSAHSAIINSVVVQCQEKYYDSQAIAGWNGPGPFLIENNLLEGAGENILFGGGDPSISGLNPSDITIRWNHIRKPTEWYSSREWTVKNLLELKAGVRVLIHNNIFENHWADAQAGWAIVMYSTGGRSWSTVSDVVFAQNTLRNSSGGINVARTDGSAAQPLDRMLLFGNSIFDLGPESAFGSQGRPIQVLNAVSNLHIEENTVVAQHTAVYIAPDGNPPPGTNFSYSRNLTSFGLYGIFGGGHGSAGISTRYSSYTFLHNCFYESQSWASLAQYPAPNKLVPTARTSIFPSYGARNFTLATSSTCYNMMPGGKSPGADPALVTLLDQRVRTGLGRP